jgi:antitoxin MazE
MAIAGETRWISWWRGARLLADTLGTLFAGCIYMLIQLPPQMARKTSLKVQRWGNSLAVRIPAELARSAKFGVGVPVELSVEPAGLLIRAVGEPQLSLAQKLAAFDPVRHGGEAMVHAPLGVEVP